MKQNERHPGAPVDDAIIRQLQALSTHVRSAEPSIAAPAEMQAAVLAAIHRRDARRRRRDVMLSVGEVSLAVAAVAGVSAYLMTLADPFVVMVAMSAGS